MRLMSVSMTEDAVRAEIKTVTRRLGWRFARVGDTVCLCRKVMGRKAGEPLVRIAEVRFVDVRREPLDAITDDDVLREGFTEDHPDLPLGGTLAERFVRFYCGAMRCEPHREVTRIEWEYLPTRWAPPEALDVQA